MREYNRNNNVDQGVREGLSEEMIFKLKSEQ